MEILMTVEDLDCGDNSCMFKKTPGGMRTNGGCGCYENAGFSKSNHENMRAILPAYLKLKQENEEMKKLIEALKVEELWL